MHTRWLLVGAVAVGLACASAAGAEKTKLVVAVGDPDFLRTNPQAQKVYDDFDKKFMQEHPDVEIERVIGPFGVSMSHRDEWYAVRYAGGTLPDVFDLNFLNARTAAANGVAMNLQPFIDKDPSYHADDFFPALWEPFKYKGGTYGIPQGGWPNTTVYNVDLFNQAGLAAPPHDWTLQNEFVTYLKKLTRDSDGDGVIDQWGADRFFASEGEIDEMLRVFGSGVLNDDETQVTVNSPKAIDTLEWWAGLAKQQLLIPPAIWRKVQDQKNGRPFFEAGVTGIAEMIPPLLDQYHPTVNLKATAAPIARPGNGAGRASDSWPCG